MISPPFSLHDFLKLSQFTTSVLLDITILLENKSIQTRSSLIILQFLFAKLQVTTYAPKYLKLLQSTLSVFFGHSSWTEFLNWYILPMFEQKI